MCADQGVSCSKQEQITTLRTCVWYWFHPSSGIILIDGVIHKTHVMPYSGKVKIKVICSHTLLLQVVSAAQCVSCSKQEHITTLRTCVWYWLHSSSGIDGVYSWNSCDTQSNSKVKTKSHLFSYFVLAGSECCPMCQLLQTGTNYHIMYMCLVLVSPIFWHFIDWWCLFMKHMWCHLVAK